MLAKIKTLIIIGFFCFTCGNAQDIAYKKYIWESDPKIHELSKVETESNYIVLKEKILLEFVYESSGQLVMYETRHCIIHFNNEKGIEEMNKIYVSYATILEEMDLKARTITSDGKVIPLSKSDVKKVDDLENLGPFLIFAMEGIDKGGEIEYLYTNKKSYNKNSSWSLQKDKIVKDVTVDIYSPVNLIYEGKGYNGFPEFTIDTALKTKNHLSASVAKIDALEEEKYSAYDANKMRFDYQLAYNTINGKARLFSWDYLGAEVYNSVFNFTKTETKAMEKLIAKLELKKIKTDELKILALEQFMKTTVNLKETDESNTIDKMLDIKYGNELCIQKIYIGIAKILDIPVELVLTTDRMKQKFDSNFQSWNSLKEYVTYFPSFDKYLSADNYSSRLGFPTPQHTGSKGLFIKETEIGDLKAGVSKIKTIETPSYVESYNNISASVVFREADFTPTINLKQEFMGYSAYYVQPGLIYADENQKKEFMESMAKFAGKETIVKSYEMSGINSTDVLVNPLVIKSVVETPHLIENAGNKYFFKVGELIGPQEELYKEKTRQTDGEVTYEHSYTRLLEIKIPLGYKIKNPDDINIEKKYIVNGNALSSFISNYKLDGDILKIKIYEDYQTLFITKAKFDEYRGVINASADFNKVVLILEKL